jgi:hypothetical protein
MLPLLAPAVWNPKSVLSSLLRGFGGAIVRASIIHLWDFGFDPHVGLKTLMWKVLVNTLPNVWFPTTGIVDRVGWDYPPNWPFYHSCVPTSFPGSFLLWSKDPGRSWSREPPDSGGKLNLISGRGSRGVCLLRLENCNFMCYNFGW